MPRQVSSCNFRLLIPFRANYRVNDCQKISSYDTQTLKYELKMSSPLAKST